MCVQANHPEVRVLRHSFYSVRGGGLLRWTEAVPSAVHRHHAECGCTVDAEARPTGVPTEVQQEITVAWPDCLVVLDDAYSTPWVKFRRACDIDAWVVRGRNGDWDPGDDDHAYFQFHREEDGVGIEVGSPGFGLTGTLLTTLFLGSLVDVSRLRDGIAPSKVVDLASIAPAQAWLHQGPHEDLMRLLHTSASAELAWTGFRLARSLRQLAAPLLADHVSPVNQLQDRALTGKLPTLAGELRDLLAPVAFDVEETELFRLVKEMEAEAETERSKV